MHPPSPTGLYWSRRGDVACAAHAPKTTDHEWTADVWKPLIPVHPKTGPRYRCRRCHGSLIEHARPAPYQGVLTEEVGGAVRI